MSMDNEIPVIAFSSNNTKNSDSFVVVNTSSETDKSAVITLKGTKSNRFKAFRTNGQEEQYTEIGIYEVENGEIIYNAPRNSATTFFAF